nr:isochorismatase family cysteine hydrolase [Nocardia crassostreae]
MGDIQQGITSEYPFACRVVPPLIELLPRTRAAGVLVVFVRFAFRSNAADLPPGNALFRTFYEAGDSFHEGSAGTEITLPVASEDVVVLKRRASAFAGTDLDLVLRGQSIDTLAIAGVATSAMVALRRLASRAARREDLKHRRPGTGGGLFSGFAATSSRSMSVHVLVGT